MPIAAILALLPSLMSGATTIVEFVKNLKTEAQQTTEWTPEIEAQFDALLAQEAAGKENQPHRKTS